MQYYNYIDTDKWDAGIVNCWKRENLPIDLINKYRYYQKKGYPKGKNHHCWKDGKSLEPYSFLFTQQLKDKIRVRDNFVCQLCKTPELECNRRLAIHHIDYDKKNCNESNLVSLCIKCNSKVNSNREYWEECFKNVLK